MSGREREGETKENAAAYIPQDLYGEILSWLPSNDLINFKLVCKDWLRLISTTGFIQKHLERSKAACNNSKIVVPFKSMVEILDCANNKSKKMLALKNPNILGSCDGLVLYYDNTTSRIAAFNPSTGESVVCTPNQSIKDDMEHDWLVCSWFGHHPSTGEYVLVLAILLWKEPTADCIVFKVYSLSPNNINLLSSSTMEVDIRAYKERLSRHATNIGTLLHGRLHVHVEFSILVSPGWESWELCCFDQRLILAYDFEGNEVLRMRPPRMDRCKTLGVVDGYLCAILLHQKQVWMMKEYGAENSWFKYADIDQGNCKDGAVVRPFAFYPNGDVMIAVISDDDRSNVMAYTNHGISNQRREIDKNLMAYTNRWGKYSLKEREIDKNLMACTNHGIISGVVIACIDSLVSPTLIALEGRQEE